MDSGLLDHICNLVNLAAQGWIGRDQQGSQPSHNRTGHAGAAHVGITVRRIAGTDSHTWGSDVRFSAIAAIYCNRAAAAEGSNLIGTVCCADAKRCCVNSRRVFDCAAGRSTISGRDNDKNPGSAYIFDDSLERSPIAAFAGRTAPRVINDVRGQVGAGIRAVEIGRGDKPLETFAVGGGRAVALIHIPAANPFRPRGDANLVASVVVTEHRAHRMGTMPVVVARLGRIGRAIGIAGMDGVMPVVVMISVQAIPAAILIF